MKLNLDNFDEKSLKNLPQEPYIMLHQLRDCIKRSKQLDELIRKIEAAEIEQNIEIVKADKEKAEQDFYSLLKKLVECASLDAVNITLTSIKDLFNAIAERLAEWRTIGQKDRERADLDPANLEGQEQLVILSQAGALLSWQSPPNVEKVDNPSLLLEIIKECEDPRVVALSCRMLTNIGGGTHTRNSDLADRITFIATAQNLLRSQEHHFTLKEILAGENKNGTKLLECDFLFEIEIAAQGLNDKSRIQTISIPREQILKSELSAPLLAYQIINDHCRNMSDNATFKAKLNAKIIWFRFITHSKRLREATKATINAIKIAYNFKQDNRHPEYIQYLKEPFMEQVVELMQHQPDKDLCLAMIQCCAVIYRLRQQEPQINDPFIRVPQPQNQDNDLPENQQHSFILRVLKDISSCRLEEVDMSFKKATDAKCLDQEVAKSSYFHFCLLRFFKSLIVSARMWTSANANEIQQYIACMLKIVVDIPSNEGQHGLYRYNLKIASEALLNLKTLVKPRYEEQHDLIKKLESRLVFEVQNLDKSINAVNDGEEFNIEQEQADRQSICRIILNILNDLVQRDRESIGMSRKIQESQILSLLHQVVQYNTPEKASLIEQFLPMYYALIGQICGDSPAVTPALIKNGVIPDILQASKDRLIETSESLYLFLFALYQISIHEEGKKYAEDLGVFQSVFNQIMNSEKLQEFWAANYFVNIRQYVFNLFDRNPVYKAVASDIIKVAIEKADSLIDFFDAKYFDLISNKDFNREQINDIIAKELKKTSKHKCLTTMVNIISLFSGSDDRAGERQINNRHAAEIFTEEIFKKVVAIHEKAAQIPALIEISLIFAKIFRFLVDSNGIPANIIRFLDVLNLSHQEFLAIMPKKLSKLDSFDFNEQVTESKQPEQAKNEDQKMEGVEEQDRTSQQSWFEPKPSEPEPINENVSSLEVAEEKIDTSKNEDAKAASQKVNERTKTHLILRNFHKFVIYVKTFFGLHTATQQQMFQDPKTVSLITTILGVMRVLLKMKIQIKNTKYLQILTDSGSSSEEVKQKQLKALKLTQKEFNALSLEERLDSGFHINLPLVQKRDSMLKEMIPGLGISVHCLDELVFKFGDLTFQTIFRQLRDNLQRENNEKNLIHMGRLAFNITKQISNQKLDSVMIDNSPESLRILLSVCTNIEELNKFAAKGWTSGVCFYEFFRLGGLHNMIECFNWLGKQLAVINEEETLRTHYLMVDRCCQYIRDFFIKFVLEEERLNVRDNRHQEVYLQTIIALKMEGFDNIKHFYQNVNNAILENLFKLNDDPKSSQNVLAALNKSGLPHLLDVALSVLNCASKGFQNCVMLKMSGGNNNRHIEMREEGNRRGVPPPPNPQNVQTLSEMMPQFDQERVIEALQQSRDNLERAFGLLEAWSAQGLYTSSLAKQNAVISKQEGAKDDSDDEVSSKKLPIITEDHYKNSLKQTQSKGLQWILDSIDIIDQNRSQSFILEAMREKNMVAESKQLNEKIESLLISAFVKLTDLLKQTFTQMQEQEQNAIDTSAKPDNIKDIENQLIKVSNLIRIIQRLIINQKEYFKLSIKAQTPLTAIKNVSYLLNFVNESEAFQAQIKDQKSVLSSNFNKLLQEYMMLLFSFVQLAHLQVQMLTSARGGSSEGITKQKIEFIRKQIPSSQVLDMAKKIMTLSAQGHLKPILLQSSILLSLRIIIDKESVDKTQREVAIKTLFDKLIEVNNNKNFKLDNKIIQSIAILYFENDQLLHSQVDKFVSRTLFSKYEYEVSQKKESSKKEENGYELSKHGLNNFLNFFSHLSGKNQEMFKKSLQDQCVIKGTKKVGANLSVDQSTIMLKELVFNETKKTITKERSLWKQLTKVVDIKNDKQMKQHMKASKKALIQSIPENSLQALQALLQQSMESHRIQIESFNTYYTFHSEQKPYLISEEEQNAFPYESLQNSLDIVSKLCLAYPAYSVAFLPQKQPGAATKKLNFFQWYIKEFLMMEMLSRSATSVKKEEDSQQFEVSYVVKSDIKLVESQVSRFLNKLTGYNSLMTLNEQLIKHQLRNRFMLEAMSNLQKAIKEKGGNPIKQRCLLLASLTVIEALINNQTPSAKVPSISGDNFLNSMRACFIRDASSKDQQNLPSSFLKILDELITDYIDVSLPSNSDIVSKCINILRIIATFVHSEKKKEEALADQKAAFSDEEAKEESKSQREQQPADQVMQEPEANVHPLQAESNSEEDSAMDDEEEEEDPDLIGFDPPQPLIQMPNHPVHEDDDEEEEDDAMDEDEAEDEDEEGAMDDLPLGEEVIDDYDEEDDGEEDELGDGMIVANRQDRRGPQLDIINPRQAAPANARPWGHGIDPFGGVGLGRRNEARAINPDWTEEEDNVQRILNNLRANNMQAQVEPQRAPGYQQYGLDRRGMWAPPGQRDPQEQQADVNIKKGLIEQTFEEFKVVSEKELYEMMISQRAALESLSASSQLPRPPRPLAGNVLGIEREYGNLFAPLGRVDEIDDMDIVRNPMGDLHFYEQLLRIQDQAMALNQDILGGLPPALFGGIGGRELLGGNWRGALHAGQAGAPIQQPDLQQYDAGLFNQQLRQQLPGLSLDQLGQQLLQQMEVQVEEIKEQQPPPSASTSAAQPQLNIPQIPQPVGGYPNPFADFRQPVMGAGRIGGQPDDDSLLQAFFNPVPSNVAPNLPQSPQVQNEQPANVPGSEADEIRRRMDEQSRQLRDQISAQQESIQRIVEVQRQSSAHQIQVGSPRLIAAPAQPQPLEHLEPAAADQPIPIASSESLEQPIQSAENIEQEPAQIQIQQNEAVIAQEEISAFEEAPENNVPIQEVSQQLEQVRLPNEEEKENEQSVAAEEVKQSENADNKSGFTFGYDNNVLLENGIDPAILAELPEELRAELLSSIDIQPTAQQQQPASLSAQQEPASQQVQEEEKKEDSNAQQSAAQAQPESAQQQQQPAQDLPEYVAIAVELGLDPEFLANLPEDMRMELIQNAQQEQRPPQRQPEQMDLASFVATVTDQNLRREIFMNMDEATIATLPPNLMAEARQVHDYVRNRQRQQRDLLQNPIDRARGIIDHMHGMGDDRDAMAELFGRRHRGEQDRRAEAARREKTLEECVNLRQKQLSDEAPKDDLLQQLPSMINNDEKILEALILILLTNDKIECGLIPCLQILTKIQSSNGVPVIRNKVINALVFILKLLSSHDQDALKTMFPNHQLKEKQSALLVIGTIRLLLKTNRGLMKFILRGIVAKDENQTGKNVNTHILRKQLKALSLKSSSEIQATTIASEEAHSSIDTSSIQVKEGTSTKSKFVFTPPSPLTEIFSLIKSDLFKQDKSLMKNLSLLIQQILKQFSIAREELELANQQISQETISSIAEVLSLDIIDENLMEDLGDFFFSISQKKQQNFQLISQYCTEKSSKLLSKLYDKLADFTSTFDDIKRRVQPGLTLGIVESRQLSSNSALEEEKGDVLMIDTQIHDNAASKHSGIKLQEDDEKRLKQLLKVHEESEILLRIFKLFNIFYMKFSELEKQKQEEGEAIEAASQQPKEVQEFVKKSYESGQVAEFVERVSEVLKVVFRVNLDMSEGLSNLIFCVFASFYPELLESIRVEEEEQKEQEKKRSKDSGKYLVRMLPLSEATVKGSSKEKTSVFRNAFYMTLRTEEFSRFCMANKRLINKMIKQRPSMFVKELEQMIKYMPNLLDFENKRTYFKKELAKLKRNQYHDQIQLFIRRDDIFMDAYAQINQRSADEMKGRMHIQFTGERGQDAGGLTRDFFIELSREMFNPSYSLFILSSSGSTYYPNPKSYVERDHLRYFKFIGRILGKALFDECLLECYFVKSLYKIMAGEALSFADIEDFDNEFYTNLKWCLENDVSCLMTTFVVEQDFFGKAEEIELVEGGKTIPVTNDNKHSYVEKLTYYKLYRSIQKQVDSFLEGFYELIPKDLVSIFNFKELELLISGLPNFDLDDLKANTEYSGYQPSSPQVQWLWEVLESLENSERAEFLQFVTGSSKVPIDGFKGLMGMRGPQKFTIAKIKTDDIMRLPSGHTCFNQLDLPEYPSKEILHERLLIAIKETKGFGFA